MQQHLFPPPVSRSELAQALGISESMVSRLVRRGMPDTDIVKAQRWRKRHLEPSRMKAPPPDLATLPPPPGLVPGRRPVTGDAAILALANRTAKAEPTDLAQLQLVLRTVPLARRRDLRIPPSVWAELVGPDVLAALLDPSGASPAMARAIESARLIEPDPAWAFALGFVLHPTRQPLNPEPENDE